MKKADVHAKKPEPVPAGGTTDLAAPVTPSPEPLANPHTPAAEITPAQLNELRTRAAKADEHWDRLLRTAADLENFKKRAARERHEAGQSATANLVNKLLPVLDHFEMAQAAAQNAQAPPGGMAALHDGIAMIQQQLRASSPKPASKKWMPAAVPSTRRCTRPSRNWKPPTHPKAR